MAKTKHPTGRYMGAKTHRPIEILAAIYAIAVLIRYLLAVNHLGHPVIMPDESIYLNIAKSLITEGRIAYNGHPLQYDSILYPLVISPIYALPAGTNYFRYVQLANALMMNAALFPAYYAAKRVLGNHKSALAVGLIALLLPDCAFVQSALTESLGYPLCFTALYIVCVALDGKSRVWPPFALAGIGFLMFMSKFSLMLFIAGMFAALLISALFRRDVKAALFAVFGGALFAALVVAERALAPKLLAIQGAEYVNYYTDALGTNSAKNVINGIKGSFVSLYLFICAACMLPIVMPVSGLKHTTEKERALTLGLIVAFLLTLGGACYLTFRDNIDGFKIAGRVELRYSAFMIPMFVMLALNPKLLGMKLNFLSGALLGYALIGSVIFTPFAIQGTSQIDNTVLAAISLEGSNAARWIYLIGGVLASAFLGFALHKWGLTRALRNASLWLLAFLFIVHSASFDRQLPDNAENNMLAIEDAQELCTILDGQEALAVTAIPLRRYTYTALDTMHNGSLPRTSLSKLAGELTEDGAYQPFRLPPYVSSEIVDRDTPDNYIVFDKEAYVWLEYAEGVTGKLTKNGVYYLIDLKQHAGKPLIKSLLRTDASFEFYRFELVIFDKAILASGRVHISMRMSAKIGEEGVKVRFTSGDIERIIDAPVSMETVELDIDIPTDTAPAIVSIYVSRDGENMGLNISQYNTH